MDWLFAVSVVVLTVWVGRLSHRVSVLAENLKLMEFDFKESRESLRNSRDNQIRATIAVEDRLAKTERRLETVGGILGGGK